MLNGATLEEQFQGQQEEFQHLLKSRENVVEYLSFDSAFSNSLYEKASAALKQPFSADLINAREELLNELNLHILKVAYEDSDKITVHLRHITRVISEFFKQLNEQQRSAIIQLHVSGVHIKELPDTISSLKNLTTLYLNRNELKILPKALCLLERLANLNLSDNQITEIDDSILRLPNLHWLAVTNNRISDNESARIAQVLQARHITFEDDTPNRATTKRQ